jgi:hypothetical protein
MSVGGQEVIVGLTSFGDVNCAQGGYDTRVDALASWIDGYVKQADPNFSGTTGGNPPPSSTPPSPSGGTQAPPTSSATPMPPSSTGAGGVGASCVSDNDCQSRLCGLSNSGTHLCFPAGANGVQGGCAIASPSSATRDAPNAAMVLTLLFGLWLKLARSRKRE